MATLTAALPVRVTPGLDTTGAAATAGGDQFVNTGKEIVLITLGASACTATFATAATIDGLAVGNPAIVCPINKVTAVGPFPVGVFNDSNNYVQITYSAVTDVKVIVLQVTPV